MIQLIASDIDGTILPYGQREPEPEFFHQVRRLIAAGIPFCAASGRQYHSLRQVFGPIQNEIYYICENGAAVFGPGEQGQLLSRTVIDRDISIALCRDIIARPDCEVVISGVNTTYLCAKDTGLADKIRAFAGNNIFELTDPAEMPEDFIKISICHHNAAELEPIMTPRWQEHFQIAVAGREWLDFTTATKGTGLQELCRVLGISPENVAAFGDNFNDVPMLDTAGHPYIMSGAHPRLLSRYSTHCDNVADTLRSF